MKVGERLPAVGQQQLLRAQAGDVLAGQLIAVGQAAEALFQGIEQGGARLGGAGMAARVFRLRLFARLVVGQRLAAALFGIVETPLLLGFGQVAQRLPLAYQVAVATAVKRLPGALAWASSLPNSASRRSRAAISEAASARKRLSRSRA